MRVHVVQKLETPQANRYTAEREALQSQNTSLRMALLTALQGLSDVKEDEVQTGETTEPSEAPPQEGSSTSSSSTSVQK